GAIRLERMRGFGATLAHLATCSCAHLELADGTSAILIASLVSSLRPPSLAERLQFILDGFDPAAAAFSTDGVLLAANHAARAHLADIDLAGSDAADLRTTALQQGFAKTASA